VRLGMRSPARAGPHGGIVPAMRLLIAPAAKLAVAVLLVVAVSAPTGAAATSGGGRVCGLLHARVPYATAGGGPVWRVYSHGNVSCRNAAAVLDAVMHLHGQDHSHGFESNSYFTYRGWTCPYGQMGSQVCFLGSTRHPRAEAWALRCSENPCPTDRPPDL
jgi:hypothetical protein